MFFQATSTKQSLDSNHIWVFLWGILESHWSQYDFGDCGVKLVNINKTFPGIAHLRTSARYEKVHSWAQFSASLSQVHQWSLCQNFTFEGLGGCDFLTLFLAGQAGLQGRGTMNGFEFWVHGPSPHTENLQSQPSYVNVSYGKIIPISHLGKQSTGRLDDLDKSWEEYQRLDQRPDRGLEFLWFPSPTPHD